MLCFYLSKHALVFMIIQNVRSYCFFFFNLTIGPQAISFTWTAFQSFTLLLKIMFEIAPLGLGKSLLSPLEKVFNFNNVEIPFTQECFVQSLVEIEQFGLEKKFIKCHICILIEKRLVRYLNKSYRILTCMSKVKTDN